jgi:hypothetical protein
VGSRGSRDASHRLQLASHSEPKAYSAPLPLKASNQQACQLGTRGLQGATAAERSGPIGPARAQRRNHWALAIIAVIDSAACSSAVDILGGGRGWGWGADEKAAKRGLSRGSDTRRVSANDLSKFSWLSGIHHDRLRVNDYYHFWGQLGV